MQEPEIVYVHVQDKSWGLFFRWLLLITLSTTMAFYYGWKLGRNNEGE